MGSIISSLVGDSAAAAAAGADDQSEVRVISFHSNNRWKLHFNSCKDSKKLLVVDFAAVWCGPCKMMEPAVHAMSVKFPDVDFAKIDVDELPDVSREFGVQAMPTFVLVKQGKEVDRVVGARKDELETKIAKHR